VTLARRIGSSMGPFCRVISSPSPWTFETAIAMGFAVDEQYAPVPMSDSEWSTLAHLMPDGTGFARISQVLREDPLGRRLADALRSQWSQYALVVPEGECALVVTHGGYIDDSAVALLPETDHRKWGKPFSHCEGIRLAFDHGYFVFGELLRI
jgi:broad specificity phosphatase PhoE